MSEESAIRAVIQTYFDSMYESDPKKVHDAFHANAKITGYDQQGELMEMSVDTFAGFVESQQPSAQEKNEPAILEVLSLDIAGDTAVTRVKDVYIGLVFEDILSLIRIDGQWKIYNKLFHAEGPA